MAIRKQQLFITDLTATVLGQKPIIHGKFDWFINKHTEDLFKENFSIITKIFNSLNGDCTANKLKQKKLLECDAFFGGKYNFMFEFDEVQHFSTARLKSLEIYPSDLKVNFDAEKWKYFCRIHHKTADRYRSSKRTKDFNFLSGRTSQRAYLDCFRDLLPQLHVLKPTLRLCIFEVMDIHDSSISNCKKIEALIKSKLNY